jgi:hypothetical protein
MQCTPAPLLPLLPLLKSTTTTCHSEPVAGRCLRREQSIACILTDSVTIRVFIVCSLRTLLALAATASSVLALIRPLGNPILHRCNKQ